MILFFQSEQTKDEHPEGLMGSGTCLVRDAQNERVLHLMIHGRLIDSFDLGAYALFRPEQDALFVGRHRTWRPTRHPRPRMREEARRS